MILGQPIHVTAVNGPLKKDDGNWLDPAGETVIATSYWLRRVADGDALAEELANLVDGFIHQPQLLLNATAPVIGAARASGRLGLITDPSQTFQATITGTGAVSATVIIEFSNDLVGWLPLKIINLSGTDMATGGEINGDAWAYSRANLTAISGTGAEVTVMMEG